MGGQKRQREDSGDAKSQTDLPTHKKRRELTERDKELAKVYNDLADEIESVRLQAASTLIKHIASDENRDAAIDTALTRLIKGINSGRKAARLGFSIALPEVIRIASQTDSQSLPQLVAKIDQLTKVEGNASGQEKRDALLGKQFALQALLQAASSFKADAALWRSPFEHICGLAGQRSWLRRQCGISLYQFIASEPKDELLQALVDAWTNQTLWKTPEGVALWLRLANTNVKLPKGIWNHQNPFSSKERAILAKVMQEVPTNDDDHSDSGTRQVTPSFAWTVLLDAFAGCEKEKAFPEFWEAAISHGLFANSSSNERKAFGLQILTLAINKLDAKNLQHILSKEIIQCIINHRVNAERYLFEAAQKPLKAIASRSEREPVVTSIFLSSLLQHGGHGFDQTTKTKTIDNLLSHANVDTLEEIADIFHDILLKPGTIDEKKAENQRRALADMLVAALRAHRGESELFTIDDVSPWVAKICHCLIDVAYEHETSEEIAEPAISSATRVLGQQRLMSCVGHLLAFPIKHAGLLPLAVLSELKAGQVAQYSKMKSSDVKILATAEKMLKGLGKKADKLLGDNAADADGLKLLLSMSMLQVYNQEPDAAAALQDLIMSIQTWIDDSSESKTIMVEIVISFISKPSAAYRKLAEQVFSVLASSMTSDSLQSLLDILQQKESASGQSELFDQNSEAQAADDDDEEAQEGLEEDDYVDVEDDSDMEVANGVVTGGAEDSDSGSDDSDEDMEDAADDEEAEFDRKLKDALGTAAIDSDDDGSDMDDDQMMALEPHLATIFKERQKQTSAKQDNKDARENIINFKNRILDLLNIYVKSQHSSSYAIELIHPLVELIRTTTSKPTSEKAFAVLKTYFESYNKAKDSSIDVEDEVLFALLSVLHAEVTEGGSKLHTNACSRSCLFITKVLVNSDPEHYKQIANMYSVLQSVWYLNPKSKIQSSMFTEWTSWSISTRTSKQ